MMKPAPAPASRPNIVFILADDLGWIDLSCQGSTFYETPNIDRLAAEGMRFSNAYAAAPVCSPTRASLLTGKYPARVGITQFIGGKNRGRLLDVPYLDHLPREETSVAAALREGGYQTWHVGKWHLGAEPYYPERHGFDVNVGGCHVGSPGKGGYFAPWSIPALSDAGVPEGTYLDDYLFQRAAELIESRDPDRPFFLNLWAYLVHTPIQAKPELVEKYRQKAERLGLDRRPAMVEGEAHPTEHKRHLRVQRRIIQSDPVYAAMIETLDTNVGRLLDLLDRLGLAGSTLVAFTSDNGGLATAEGSPTCNAPLAEGKGWVYEGGTREPLLVRWPGTVPPSSTCGVPVTSPDLYPTLLDVAGLPPRPEQHLDGESLLPLLRGGDALQRDAIFWHYPHYPNQGATPACSIRAGDHKLIRFFEDDRIELFDLVNDPGEHFNLAQRRPDLAADLRRRLDAWLDDVGATLPQPNPDYVPHPDPLADPTV